MAQRCSHPVSYTVYNDARKHVQHTSSVLSAACSGYVLNCDHCSLFSVLAVWHVVSGCTGTTGAACLSPGLVEQSAERNQMKNLRVVVVRSVSWAQVMCQPTLPLHGDGQSSITLTML